jgi:hypothetical protein
MATALKAYNAEEQNSVVRFCGQKNSMQKTFTKKCLVFTAGSCSQLGGKGFADDEEVETEVRGWLRQQSKDYCALGFVALVKRWDKYVNVFGGYDEKLAFNVRSTHICTLEGKM